MSSQVDETVLEESLEELYEDAPSGYLSTLPDGTIVKVNRTFLSWIGYTREELLGGMRFQDLLRIEGKIFYETHFAPLLHMQGFVSEIAFDVVCQDGQRVPVLVNSIQKRDASGAPLLNRITVLNATDRRKYEQELLLARKKAEQAAQTKSRFLSTISHEIRTPISSINMILRLLEQTDCSPEQQQYLHVLKSASRSLLDLVNDVLDYSKIESGRVALDERVFNIRELIDDICRQFEAMANEKKLSLRVDIDQQVPERLIGDPLKIGQIITNLVSNAMKFTDKGFVQITLRVTQVLTDAVSLQFSVKDTGIGIPPDRVNYIFEEFAQASSDITERYGGTGLGLAISRKLLYLYGSEMKVESTPGIGSTFSFSLQLKVATEAA